MILDIPIFLALGVTWPWPGVCEQRAVRKQGTKAESAKRESERRKKQGGISKRSRLEKKGNQPKMDLTDRTKIYEGACRGSFFTNFVVLEAIQK